MYLWLLLPYFPRIRILVNKEMNIHHSGINEQSDKTMYCQPLGAHETEFRALWRLIFNPGCILLVGKQ